MKVCQFFASESYLIQYVYEPESGKSFKSIFYYQLRNSSIMTKGSSAIQTVELDSSSTGGEAKQIRVVDMKESMF